MRVAAKAAEIIGAAFFFGMFAMFIVGVFMRYVLGRPLTWNDEVCVILLLWSMFWSAAFVVRDDEQVTFDIVYQPVSAGAKRAMGIAGALLCAAIFAAALPATFSYIGFLWREITPALQIRLDYVYSCFALFLAAATLRLLLRGGRLFGRDWTALI